MKKIAAQTLYTSRLIASSKAFSIFLEPKTLSISISIYGWIESVVSNI